MQDPSAFQPMKPQFPEQERLKCPRCESTNTKFCYYNNYNLSQPRHFCKNCRRYWTKGGALRNIPVGGGTRKNAKRPNAANNNDNSSNNNKRPGSGSEPEPEQKYGQGASLDSSHTPPPLSAVAPASQPRPNTNGVDPTRSYFPDLDPARVHGMGVGSESFSSLLASNMQFGGILEGLHSTGSGLKMVQLGGLGVGGNLNSGSAMNMVTGSGPELGLSAAENNSGSESESYLSLQNGGDSSCWGNSNAWPDLAIYTPGSRFQ